MIIKKDIEIVLWATIEDLCGLWEVPWELKIFHKDIDKYKLKLLSIRTIQFLSENQLIKLYHCIEPYGSISEIDNYDLINQESPWKVPNEGDKAIRISATRKGQNLYQNSNYQDYLELVQERI